MDIGLDFFFWKAWELGIGNWAKARSRESVPAMHIRVQGFGMDRSRRSTWSYRWEIV